MDKQAKRMNMERKTNAEGEWTNARNMRLCVKRYLGNGRKKYYKNG